MHAFDRARYRTEMNGLLAAAEAALRAEAPDAVVYTVGVWTDPDAAVSAVNFDTAEHSAAAVARSTAWAAKHHARLTAAGDDDGARAFAPRPGARCENPANFALPRLAMTTHAAFAPGWAAATEGRCWEALGPALREVREVAARRYAHLPLHPDALVAVNSAEDWYAGPVGLRRAAS